MPWLYADPVAKLSEWRNLSESALAESKREEEELKVATRRAASDLTRRRIQRQLQGRVEFRKALESLLEPFGAFEDSPVDVMRVLAGKAASTQTLTSYGINAIRDWGWPETEENRRSLELVLDVFGSGNAQGSMVVLGAGAGRLAYDLHEAGIAATTLTLDINPFLTFVAERLFKGKTLVLPEFPIAPDCLEHVAINRKLAAPGKATPGLGVLFGDVLSAPLAKGQFDVVVTPWLIDILPEHPEVFFSRLNSLLKPGGIWLNHGSFAFQQGGAEKHSSLEELIELVAARGFVVERKRTDRVPYLCSPASCQARHETVLTFAAKKVGEVAQVPAYRPLPSWLENTSLPIPRTDRLQQLGHTHLLFAEVLGLIDGHRSVAALSELLGKKHGLEPERMTRGLVSLIAQNFL